MTDLTELADNARKLLCDQSISAAGPGTIIRDVETLIEFIGETGLKTQSKQGNLPSEALAELNARLTAPIENHLKRPLLRNYPNIGGIYVLLRVMGLARSEGNQLKIDCESFALWRGLNPVEQYFSLMEAWLFHADGGVLGSSQTSHRSQYTESMAFLGGFKGSNWKGFHEYGDNFCFPGTTSAWNAQLHARFGFIEIKVRPLKGRRTESRGWMMQKARRTPWGEAVVWAILSALANEDSTDNWIIDPPEEGTFGMLHPVFRFYRPEWKKVYQMKQPAAVKGTHIFKVKFASGRGLSGISCLLAVPSEASLEELAPAVLEAFKFIDLDHLYEFRYKDSLGKTRVYSHYYCEEGPWASDIKVGATGLPLKGMIKFLFDFGDCWEFELQLDRIEPPGNKKASIEVLESIGEPPPQYPDSESGW